eukprot:m.116623 g.116623  ORF g.116623 m.116623 type:complete len:421 (+) comp28524_c0_seq1:67-1329(+)
MALILREKEWEFFDSRVPWKYFQSFEELGHPTFAIAEVLFGVATLVSFIHAIGHGRQHVLTWIAALSSGVVNDIFFMVLPFVDNFFHAQFMVMVTPRLPLYILFAYICFQYVAAVGSWRLGLSPMAQAAAASLAGALYYSIYDVVGAKFLWWSWHDSDAPISNRWLGVPIGSTMWTLVHQFCFNLLLHHVALKYKQLSITKFVSALFVVTVMTTPFMMISMGPPQLFQIEWEWTDSLPVITQLPGKPDILSISIVIAVLLLLVLMGYFGKSKEDHRYSAWLKPGKALDYFLYVTIWLHFVSLMVVMAFFDPSTVVSTGMHQEYGSCDVQERDLMGYPRFSFLCKEKYDEDFHFDCDAAVNQSLPPKLSSWYTICGKAFIDQRLYVGATIAISTVALSAFTMMFVLSGASRGATQNRLKTD